MHPGSCSKGNIRCVDHIVLSLTNKQHCEMILLENDIEIWEDKPMVFSKNSCNLKMFEQQKVFPGMHLKSFI